MATNKSNFFSQGKLNLFCIAFSGSPKRTSLVLVASGCITCGSSVSTLCSVHELTKGSSPENPAYIDLFFQRPVQMTNRLELPEKSPSPDCDDCCSFCCFCTSDLCLSKSDYCGSPPEGTTSTHINNCEITERLLFWLQNMHCTM